MNERLELLIGKKVELVAQKHVLILGLGGVGGYAAESIVRSGIKEITIIDADRIVPSNINRQIIATTKNIGQYKTDVLETRLKDINPNLVIHKFTQYITPNNLEEIFVIKPDYVIDCCDSISTKEAIISYCVKHQIKLISSMGTGNKLHPERLKIMKLKDTSYDPIAKKLRKYVKEQKIKQDIYVVCSDEPKVVQNVKDIPSNAFVPAIAGLLCTSYVINDIIK